VISRGVAGESVWVRAGRVGGETRTECVFSSFCLLNQNNNDKDSHYIFFVLSASLFAY
jgi:hypothetical protein